MAAATHRGTCQACGSVQKLPSVKGMGPRISLHGYTITYGYFSGTCRGSRYLPFEESCDQVQRYIGEARSALAGIEAEQARLRQPANEPMAWVHHYVRSRNGRSRYEWREVQVNGRRREKQDWVDYFYTTHGETAVIAEVRIDAPYDIGLQRDRDESLQVATWLNSQRADWLEREAKDLRRYIAWQEDRVAKWQPSETYPIKDYPAKVLKGTEFVPKEPGY